MTPAAQALVARIHSIRGHKVMLDADLAELYGVQTKALIQAVKRNSARFPSDFMFSLMEQEVENLRSQIVTSSSALRNWGGRRTAPYAFIESVSYRASRPLAPHAHQLPAAWGVPAPRRGWSERRIGQTGTLPRTVVRCISRRKGSS